MIPALQARALAKKRTYVNADDVQSLAYFIFGHRLELAPGSGTSESVVADICRRPLESLARQSLKR